MNADMRCALCTGPGQLAIETRPTPSAPPGHVLVKVAMCGVCASDLAVWRGRAHQAYPYSPGHEFCGVVERVGDGVGAPAPGQRVVVNPNLGCGDCRYCAAGKPNLCDFLKSRAIKSNGGFSDYVALDRRMTFPLPDTLSDDVAPFVEPLSCAMHAARQASVQPGENVAVFGAGTMGFLTALLLRDSGARLCVVEPAAARRMAVGALLGLPAMTPEDLPAGDLDVAIDFSGAAAAIEQAVRSLAKAGRLVMAGLVHDTDVSRLPLLDVTAKELSISGAWLNPAPFEDAIQAAVSHRDILAQFNTEVFALDDVVEAFVRAASPDVHRVLVRP